MSFWLPCFSVCGLRFGVLLEELHPILEDCTVILEHLLTLFEHLGYLLEQRALILENPTFIRSFFAILEQPGNILENAPQKLNSMH